MTRPGSASWATAVTFVVAAFLVAGLRARASVSRLSTPPLLITVLFTAGTVAGADTVRAIRSGCESSIETGTPVAVRGYASEGVSGSREGSLRSGRRITLEDVVLTSRIGTCLIPRVTVFARAHDISIPVGKRAALKGEWLRLRARSSGRFSLDIPGRTGIVIQARAALNLPSVTASGRGIRSTFAAARRSVRSAAAQRLRVRLPADVDATARALLLAERDELPAGLRRRFADAGLAHLLAISGLHVGIVAGLVLALARPFVRGKGLYLVSAGVVGLYVAVLGAPVPALRATLIFTGWATARFAGRPLRGADLLGAVALLFLVSRPSTILEPGFQLSFAGFAGVAIGPAATRTIFADRRPTGRSGIGDGQALYRGLRTGLLAGTGAFLATAPFSALHFGRIAPVSVISNLVGSPLVALSIWGLTGALLPDPLGTWFAGGAAACVRALHIAVGWFGDLTAGHLESAPPSPETWLAWLCGFGLLARIARGVAPARILVPAAVLLSVSLGQPVTRLLQRRSTGLLCTLSVGQGDAAILRTFEGRWLVFDGGPDRPEGAGREEVGAALRRRGARAVALVVLSHPDLDHIGGLPGLLSSVPVGGVLDTADPLPRAPYARLLAVAEQAGIPWLTATPGTRIRVDGAEVLVLGPDPAAARTRDGRTLNGNQTSLVVRVDLAGFRYVNPGDATAIEEAAILSSWPLDSLRADLLKVGHHGSRTSTSAGWLSAVRPRIAAISAGNGNRYGHPHPEVVERLDSAAIPTVWRTDRSGSLCIEIRRDGRWRIDSETAWNAPVTVDSAVRHGD
jgi:competence protein ComEC